MTKIVKKKSEPRTLSEANTAKAKEVKYTGCLTKLLVSHDETVDDKIATVKTARLVDKGRFDTAFKRLMKG